MANAEFVEEVGGGLNLKRPKFVAIIDCIEAGDPSHLIVAHKDRRFCAEHGAEPEVLNNDQLSPEQETVQDLLTTIRVSQRLHGLRNYHKKLNEALAEDVAQ